MRKKEEETWIAWLRPPNSRARLVSSYEVNPADRGCYLTVESTRSVENASGDAMCIQNHVSLVSLSLEAVRHGVAVSRTSDRPAVTGDAHLPVSEMGFHGSFLRHGLCPVWLIGLVPCWLTFTLHVLSALDVGGC